MATNRVMANACGLFMCVAVACASGESGEKTGRAAMTTDTTVDERLNPSSNVPEAEPGSQPVSETGVCNNLLNASDVPFATAVFAISDACPSQRRGTAPLSSPTIADVRHEAPGKYCARGALAGGFATLIVSFDHINDIPAPPFHGPLDAAALGITQFRFTVDSPPASGLQVSPSNVVRDECPFSSDECIQSGLYVLNEAGAPITITQAGTYTQRFTDYRPGPGVPPALTLDTTRLAGLGFELNPGEFDVCVSDVQLLDDAGKPVSPSE
jgi:hypothetical protein